MTTNLKVLSLAAAVLLVGACASARRSEPITGKTLEGGAEFSEGRRVFIQHCHTCHPGGEAGLGPALNNKPIPRAMIKFQVRHGLGTMPAFKEDRINSAELDALAAYLIALRKSD
jgi:mono/diheme cytochrome c family protein